MANPWTNPAATDPTRFSRAAFHDTTWRLRHRRMIGLADGPYGYRKPAHCRAEYTHTRPRATRWWLGREGVV